MPEMNAIPECDYCDATENLKKIGDSTVCPLHVADATPRKAPISANDVIKQAREIDSRTQVRTDIFNAETMSIETLREAIENDANIVNKPYTLAVELQNRFANLRALIQQKQDEIIEASNKQRATQVYLNQLANKLRDDEREKLRIADINYKPRNVKMPVTAKTIKMSKQKIDTAELRKYAHELGIPEFTLRMVAIQKNLTASGVYKLFKAQLDAAKPKSE